MAHGGAANSYYNNGPDKPVTQTQMQYPPQAPYTSNIQGGLNYQQAPPKYGDSYQNAGATSDSKQTFDQAFKLDRPKYNDLWAGILVRRFHRASVLRNI